MALPCCCWGYIVDDSGTCSSSVDTFSGNSSLDMVVREIQLSTDVRSHNFMCKIKDSS